MTLKQNAQAPGLSVCLCAAGDRDGFIQYIGRKWRHKSTSFHGGAKNQTPPREVKRDAIG